MNHQTPHNEFSNPESQLESAIQFVVAQPIDNEAIDRVKNRAKDLIAQSTVQASNDAVHSENVSVAAKQPQPRFKRSFWMSAIAASLILTVGLSLVLSGKKASFAKAIEALHSVQTLSFDMVIDIDFGKTEIGDIDDAPRKNRVFVAKDGRWRSQTDDFVVISDVNGNGIMLTESTKLANLFTNEEMEDNDFDYLNWFEKLKKSTLEPGKKLGKKMLSGRQVEGYVVADIDDWTKEVSIWIDSKTNRIAQIELEEKEEDIVVKMTINNLKFNVPLEESLFNMEVPSGYTIGDDVEDNESTNAFASGLRKIVENSDGVFPESIVEPKFDMTNVEAMEGVFEISMFLHGLDKKDFGYVGAGKKLDGEQVMVFWVRRDGKIQAVYNDLTIAEIAENDIVSENKE